MHHKKNLVSQLPQIYKKQSSFGICTTLNNQQRTTKVLKSFEKIQLQIKNQKLNDLFQIYSWRSKIQLPIVKVLFYKIVETNLQQKITTIDVTYQSCNLFLSDLKQISFQNVIYMLKQSILGFYKLFQIFGSFLISNKMIALNKNNKCRVWINQNFTINQPIDVELFKNLTQKQFINQILILFQKKTQKNKISEILFSALLHCNQFSQIYKKIQQFIQAYNIQSFNSFKFQQKNQLNSNISKPIIKFSPQKFKQSLNDSIKNKPIPKFLNKTITNPEKTDRTHNPQRLLTQYQSFKQTNNKNRSISPFNTHQKTPIKFQKTITTLNIHDKIGHKNPLKSFLKCSIADSTDYKNKKISKREKKPNDCSFDMKGKYPSNQSQASLLLNMISSDNMIYQPKIIEKINFLHKNTKTSDLNTSHSNSSQISNLKLHQKLSLNSCQSQETNILQSIIVGQQEPIRKSFYSTFDLEKLGKLGKHIGSSLLPQDFLNQIQQDQK